MSSYFVVPCVVANFKTSLNSRLLLLILKKWADFRAIRERVGGVVGGGRGGGGGVRGYFWLYIKQPPPDCSCVLGNNLGIFTMIRRLFFMQMKGSTTYFGFPNKKNFFMLLNTFRTWVAISLKNPLLEVQRLCLHWAVHRNSLSLSPFWKGA